MSSTARGYDAHQPRAFRALLASLMQLVDTLAISIKTVSRYSRFTCSMAIRASRLLVPTWTPGIVFANLAIQPRYLPLDAESL